MDKEVQKLRVIIAAHVGSLQMRLLTLGLTSTIILFEETKTHNTSQEKNLADVQTTAVQLQKRQVSQETVNLVDIANQIWKSNLQISNIIIKCETQLPCPDLRHTWLQPPVRLEDPLRRYLVIPSEYSYGMMQAVIVEQPKSGPGSTSVQSGNYEIVNAKNYQELVTSDGFTGLIPGMSLRMAIALYRPMSSADQSEMESCPDPGCGAMECKDTEGGGKACCACGLWFTPKSRKCRKFEEVEEDEPLSKRPSKRRKTLETHKKEADPDAEEANREPPRREGPRPPQEPLRHEAEN
ncbi:uncharacterized protein A1O9_00355 [Exophiala aquamarina CBS 119918]|uniref:Ubiquitin-like domain-containing protein n=1 Tax=Exophiala aquamarina CBS 119918 TaxID=1182545 RepID=A0A072PSS4_9EURO|nr:uncharacterized protein A1O9_00355 [Exophiala aquamarina CBS 119918]KEF62383.1 hypothetical protein A1O9_00355 [Exophiala aquamarina CBS 119918]